MLFPPLPRWAHAVLTAGARPLCYFHSLSPPVGAELMGSTGRWQPLCLRPPLPPSLHSTAEDAGAERQGHPPGAGVGGRGPSTRLSALELVPFLWTSVSCLFREEPRNKEPSGVTGFPPFPPCKYIDGETEAQGGGRIPSFMDMNR